MAVQVFCSLILRLQHQQAHGDAEGEGDDDRANMLDSELSHPDHTKES